MTWSIPQIEFITSTRLGVPWQQAGFVAGAAKSDQPQRTRRFTKLSLHGFSSVSFVVIKTHLRAN
jgi:hypothetical protein